MRVSKALILATWLLTLLIGTGGARAQGVIDPPGDSAAKDKEGDVEHDGREYGGVVLNQTLTSLGREFYTKFSDGWSQFNDVETYVVLIKERWSARAGTEMLVYSEESLVFRASLPRSLPAVMNLSDMALEQVHQVINEAAVQAKLFKDPDLATSAF
jgi:hypothetical protein